MLNLVKTTLSLILGSVAGWASAAPTWSVQLRQESALVDSGIVKLTMQSQEKFSSMCNRSVQSLQVTAPFPGASTPEEPETLGRISLETVVSPLTPCLMAFGSHHAEVAFKRGETLPNLPEGWYRLVIDGEDHGLLQIAEKNATLAASQPAP